MIVQFELVNKAEATDDAAFAQYWRNGHAALSEKLTGVLRYHQNRVLDRQQRSIDYARGAYEYDTIDQLWFESISSMEVALTSDAAATRRREQASFVGDSATLTAIQHIVIPRPPGVPLIKRMSTLKRRADVDAELFAREWFDVHSALVRRIPQVKGYTQNLVIDRRVNGEPAPRDELAIDGFVELWFEDLDQLNDGFRSDAGRTLMTHATEFIGEISTFLVDPLAFR